MIALAVAALLTITALAIWAAKVTHRPVDWEGPFTTPPLLGHLVADMFRRAAITPIPAAPLPVTIEEIEAAHKRFVQQRDRALWGRAGRPIPDLALLRAFGLTAEGAAAALNRALRASERDDHRKEDR